VDLYIHFPIRHHGVMLNSLSTGTTLPFFTCLKTQREFVRTYYSESSAAVAREIQDKKYYMRYRIQTLSEGNLHRPLIAFSTFIYLLRVLLTTGFGSQLSLFCPYVEHMGVNGYG
jgi:hypothetical protein